MLKVEIDYDSGLFIFGVVLKQQYLDLSPNIGGCPMYSYDKEENKREFDKLKQGFEAVAEYNGVKL
jgi:hypothetical protein